jgi:hypothetical protein
MGNAGYSASRTFAAAMLGGSVSAATGGKFAAGAATAACSRAFNDEGHQRAMNKMMQSQFVEDGSGSDLGFFSKYLPGTPEDHLYRSSLGFPDKKGFFFVDGHGFDNGEANVVSTRYSPLGSNKIISPARLASMILASPRYNAGDHIVLLSCFSAKNGMVNALAAELSRRGASGYVTGSYNRINRVAVTQGGVRTQSFYDLNSPNGRGPTSWKTQSIGGN